MIPKDIILPKAIVLDKEHKELYKEAITKTAEKFGKDSQAYKTIINGISAKEVTGSQFFWNTNLNQYLPNKQRVISLSDMEKINDIDETFFTKFYSFYSDTTQIILRNDKPSWDQNKYILENLVKQVKDRNQLFSSDSPLIISNLELIQNDNSQNKYGLLLKINDNTTMQNDERFAHSNNQQRIKFGKREKTIYTKENGLSRLYLNGDGGTDSRNGYLADSNGNGRVVVVDAEGVDFEKYKKELIRFTEKRTTQIKERTEKAIHYIETGKLE